MKKLFLVLLLFCLIISKCGSDKEELPTENTPNEWSIMAENPERYKEIMSMIGKNFNTYIFEQEDYPNLTEQELATVKGLYDYYQANECLPDDFLTAFTEFCVGPEFHNFIVIAEENPFYAALSNSFEIGWKTDETYHLDIKKEKEISYEYKYGPNGYITEENPFIMTFEDATYNVGVCTFTLNEIQMINNILGAGYHTNDLRLFLTVTNNSNAETTFNVEQTPAGLYYQSDGDLEYIRTSFNFIGWDVDEDNPIYDNMNYSQTIPANTTKEFCVQLEYSTTDKLQFTDKPHFDFYFTNNDELFTLAINEPQ